jgi:hypothetical protein
MSRKACRPRRLVRRAVRNRSVHAWTVPSDQVFRYRRRQYQNADRGVHRQQRVVDQPMSVQ